MDLILNDTTPWLLLTAVLFTAVGWVYGKKSHVNEIVASTIDSLIEDGYLKTRGTGKDMEVLKWREWDNDKTD